MKLYMRGKPRYIKYFLKHAHREHPATRGRMHIERKEKESERGELYEERGNYWCGTPKNFSGKLVSKFGKRQHDILKGGIQR